MTASMRAPTRGLVEHYGSFDGSADYKGSAKEENTECAAQPVNGTLPARLGSKVYLKNSEAISVFQ